MCKSLSDIEPNSPPRPSTEPHSAVPDTTYQHNKKHPARDTNSHPRAPGRRIRASPPAQLPTDLALLPQLSQPPRLPLLPHLPASPNKPQNPRLRLQLADRHRPHRRTIQNPPHRRRLHPGHPQPIPQGRPSHNPSHLGRMVLPHQPQLLLQPLRLRPVAF